MKQITVRVSRELKGALREQAKSAGVTLSEWVRLRLEVRAILQELAELGRRIEPEGQRRTPQSSQG